jgi:hypothetical protein
VRVTVKGVNEMSSDNSKRVNENRAEKIGLSHNHRQSLVIDQGGNT